MDKRDSGGHRGTGTSNGGGRFGSTKLKGGRVTYGGKKTELRAPATGRLFGSVSGKQKDGSRESVGSTTKSLKDRTSGAGELKMDAYEYLEGLKSDLALELEINKLELLASLVPARIIRHHMSYSDKSKRVFCEKFQAAVLFADISGFSNLAERLVKEINHVAYAAENLSRYIGASLEQMVDAICRKGGDVIKFAGDAILAVFPVEEFGGSLEKATLCCSQVALELVSYDFKVARRNGSMNAGASEDGDKSIRSSIDSRTGRGTGKSSSSSGSSADANYHDSRITLSVHCGVGCGDVIAYHVGGLNDRWEYVVTGSPVEQIGQTEPEAEAGQTVVSGQTYRLLKNSLVGKELPSGNFLLSGFSPKASKPFPSIPLIFDEINQFTSKDPLQYQRLKSLLQCYVPSPALVSIDSGNGIWSGELRIVSTMFCRLLGLKFEGNESDVNTVQNAFAIVHKQVLEFEGTMLRFIVDDKGAGVLTAFGLPPLKHENDSVRAIKAALRIEEDLESISKQKSKNTNRQIGCSIGITTGEVFCGTVGGKKRCEYTLHGVKVNLAARLMVAAKKGALCDKETFRDSNQYIRFSKPKEIQVKGKEGKAVVYRPRQAKLIVAIDEGKQVSLQIGRKKEEVLVKRVLRNVMDPHTGYGSTLVVTGDAGMGKTRLCQYALSKARNRPFITLVARGDDTEMHTPFFIWKSLFPQLLQCFISDLKMARMSDQDRLGLIEERIPLDEAFSFVSNPRDSSNLSDMDSDDESQDFYGSLEAIPEDGGGNNSSGTFDPQRDNSNDEALDEAEYLGEITMKRSNFSSYNKSGTSNKKSFKPSTLLKEALGLLWRVLPRFFNLNDYVPKEGNTEVQMVNLVRLLTEIVAKASKDLENADRYFDPSTHGIEANRNCVRLVIIVEDLQWADHYSLETIHRIIERNLPISFMLTCRGTMMGSPSSSSIIPTAESPMGAEMLRDWFANILAGPHTTSCQLGPLSQSEIHECLKQWIQADKISTRITRLVFEKSQGHPLFAAELCKLMSEDQYFTIKDGECILSKAVQGADDFGLPGTISALMTSRLDRIPASEQLTLKVAAVIGTEFRVHVLAAVLLGYTGADEKEENILEDTGNLPSSPSSEKSTSNNGGSGSSSSTTTTRKSRVKSMGTSKRSSYNHEKMVRALKGEGTIDDGDFDVDDENRKSVNHKTERPTAVAAAGDLREISKLLDENIRNLVSRGFLHVDTDINGDQVVRFTSVMLRESAYSLLLFKMRKALHLQVAEFFQDKFEDYLQPVYFLLANHYYCAESYDRAIFFLQVAGNDALEISSMQPVWICFTRLLTLVQQGKVAKVAPWVMASWHRKVGEANMFFGHSLQAEDSLRHALAELRLDCTSSNYHRGSMADRRDSTKSWTSKLRDSLKRSGGAGGATDGRGSLVEQQIQAIAGGSENKLLKPQNSSGSFVENGSISKINFGQLEESTYNGKTGASTSPNVTLNRGVFQTKFVRDNSLARKQPHPGTAAAAAAAAAGSQKNLNEAESEGKSSSRWFFRRFFKEKNQKSKQKSRCAEVQKNMRKYKRVEDLKSYKSIYKNQTSNVEMFLEASKVYELLGSLVEDQRSALALERRLNSISLAKAAYKCAQSRPPVSQERVYEHEGASEGDVILDLNDHKAEHRRFDPHTETLDQLALSYADAALFYRDMNIEWARGEAERYFTKALDLFPNVRAGMNRGKITMALGHYSMLVGDFDQAEYYLKRSTWIFNFLHFQRLKLQSLELLTTLHLIRGRSVKAPLILARQLYHDGIGIFCVNCLCSLIELRAGNYGVAEAYLGQILEVPLDFLRSPDNKETRQAVEQVCSMITGQRWSGESTNGYEGLIVMAMLLSRRFEKKELGLQVASLAAKLARSCLTVEKVSITNFYMLLAIFQIFIESFTFFVDAGKAGSNRRLGGGTNTSSVAPRNSMAHETETVHTNEGEEEKEYAYSKLDRTNPRPELTSELQQITKIGNIRKQSVTALTELYELIEHCGAIYSPCKPYAIYCDAILQAVKSNRITNRVKDMLENAAEEAQRQAMTHLKLCALMELAISRREIPILEELPEKFAAIQAPYEKNRAKAECVYLSTATFASG